MTNDTVFLRNKGDIVGYAKYVLVNEIPSSKLHGHPLSDLAAAGETLVGVHSVQIFFEFQDREYPYSFKSFEDIPVLLGDLNKTDKAYKQVIAWDQNKIVSNPGLALPKIGDKPQVVSVNTISSIRDALARNPSKVRFVEDVSKDLRSLGKRPFLASSSSSLPHGPGVYRELEGYEVFEDSIDGMSNTSEGDDFLRNFDESVAQFEQEMDRENSFEMSNGEEDEKDYSRLGKAPLSQPTQSQGQNTEYLSPSERISKRIRDRKKRSLDDQSLNFSSPARSHQSKTRKKRNLPTRVLFQERIGTNNSCEESSGHCARNEDDHQNDESHCFNDSLAEPGHRTENASASESELMHAAPQSRQIGFGSLGNVSRTHTDHLEGSPRGGGSPDVVCQRQGTLLDLSVSKIIKKRCYRFNERKKAQPKAAGQREVRRLQLWKSSFQKNPFEGLEQCCRDNCPSEVNQDYAIVQYRRFLLMERTNRKRALKSMYDREARLFRFDGNPVCSRFVAALSFSNQLQSAVKATPRARASASVVACLRDNRRGSKKDMIILFLNSLAGAVGDALPTRNHTNLPLLGKRQVYQRFLKMKRLPGEEMVSWSYFCSVWKMYCGNIKTHRRHGFTVCSLCEQLRSSLADCESEEMQAVIRKKMEEHYKIIQQERRGYTAKMELSKKFTARYLSLIVDGADQKSYGLPHFLFNTKDDHGHKLKVKCVGVLEHGLQKHLSLFTMTEEFESGANHVIEAVHRVLNKKKSDCGKLPEVLFLQADNCTRENKNHFFMAYFQILVALGVFREVQISFLPIGHTHADIDQAFSCVANRLNLFEAVTMESLLNELNHCYTPRASAELLDKVANFSGLCQTSHCLLKVHGFSQYRYFRFTHKRVSDSTKSSLPTGGRVTGINGMPGAVYDTTCDVKIQFQDEWSPLDFGKHRRGFLKHVPDLRLTPPTDTTPPTNVLEVNKHFQSCEGRLKTEENLRSLEALRDRIYTRRVEDFHWDMETSYELNGDYQDAGESSNMDRDTDNFHNGCHMDGVGYALNDFVAVKTGTDADHPFWIARTLKIERKDDGGHATHLKVRWYQLRKDSKDPFSGRYEMSTYMSGKQRKYYDDVVDVGSVLCQFESLTQKGGLHVRTQKSIRQCLNLN